MRERVEQLHRQVRSQVERAVVAINTSRQLRLRVGATLRQSRTLYAKVATARAVSRLLNAQ